MYDDDDVRAELVRMTEGDPLAPIDGERLADRGQRSRRRRLLGAGSASLAVAAAIVTVVALSPLQAGNGAAAGGGAEPAGSTGTASGPGAVRTSSQATAVPPTQAAPDADGPTVLRACSANLKIRKARQDPSAPPPHMPFATDLTGWRITARSVLANVGTVFAAVSPDGKLSADCRVYKPGSPGNEGLRSQVYTMGPDAPSVDPQLFAAGQTCDTQCDGWMVEDVGRTFQKVAKFRVESKTSGKAVEVPVNHGWYALIWANGDPRKQPDLKVTAYDSEGTVIPADPDFQKKMLALPVTRPPGS